MLCFFFRYYAVFKDQRLIAFWALQQNSKTFLERVTIAAGIHLFPFRTEKLSPPAPMVLQGRPCGRVGRRPFLLLSLADQPVSPSAISF